LKTEKNKLKNKNFLKKITSLKKEEEKHPGYSTQKVENSKEFKA
jgi:hypothetical protein